MSILSILRRSGWPRLLGLAVFVLILPVSSAVAGPLDLLEEEIARLAKNSGGTMGVAAVHLESGRSVYLNGTERFPMASSYKVPIAVQLLHRVDEGELSLSDWVSLKESDLHPGSGMLSELLDDPGVALSLRNLLELMLIISDNSATDLVLKAAGGGEAVTARMNALGLEGIRVDRPTFWLIGDYMGVDRNTLGDEGGREAFRQLGASVPARKRLAAAKAFVDDPRDTATPRAMAALLWKIWEGTALSGSSTALLQDIMTRCDTGENRIKGKLPAGTVVAHKTGTIGGTTNDIGVMTLPGGAGHAIVVTLVKESGRPVPERENAIAQVARAIHDFFVFHRE